MARVTSKRDAYVTVEGLADCLKAFNSLEKELRKNANGEIRAASKAIANSLVPMLGGSNAPQESAILAAAGAKSDRYVVLAVPNKKPKLSGMKKTPAAMAKRIGFAVEGGSDAPQFHGPAEGSMVARHRDRIARHAIPRYTAALIAIQRRYGLGNSSG
jgi:hypothetical protein